MQIVIDIPDKDIPERGQYMLDAYFDFHTGELCSCSYPYTVLPKGHGRLIGSPTMEDIEKTIGGENDFADCIRESVKAVFDNVQTIVPADREVAKFEESFEESMEKFFAESRGNIDADSN